METTRNATLLITIIGRGRVGQALYRQLTAHAQSAKQITLQSIRDIQSKSLFDKSPSDDDVLKPVVMLTVPDQFLEESIDALIRDVDRGVLQKLIFLHTSGIKTASVFTDRNLVGGSLHPAIRVAPETNFADKVFTFEGSAEGFIVAQEIVSRLQARVFQIQSGQKALYHGAATIASNLVQTLIDEARICFINAGVSSEEAIDLVSQLAISALPTEESSVRKFSELITGPAVRNDLQTIEQHKAAIKNLNPVLESAYVAVTKLLQSKLATTTTGYALPAPPVCKVS